MDALRALEAVGLSRRDDVFWALHAVLVRRPEDREVFRRAFESWWRAPGGSALPQELAGRPVTVRPPRPRPGQARVAPPREMPPYREESLLQEEEPDLHLAWSDREVSRTRDFEQMTADEAEAARRAVRDLTPALPHRPSRRPRWAPRPGRADLRRTLRAMGRSGHGFAPLQWVRPDSRPLDVVLLVDISGSMDRYARILLQFAHTLTAGSRRVHTFVFGTRLTDVTRQLRRRDADDALSRVGVAAGDWSGGTRIGAALESFNRRWSRRILGRGAVVLLFTDGLDRDGAAGIAREAARLRRSCRRLVWLNPLLRWEGFEPRAAGVRALLAEVDEHRPIHSLERVEQLAEALSRW